MANVTGPKPKPEAERFWPKVDVRGSDECWPWLGATNHGGYGCFRTGSLVDGSRRQVNASQWVCEQQLGRRFVRGEMACHRCDNPPCVNPVHLYVGDARTNGRDASERGLLRPPSQPGASNPNAKLSEGQALAVLRSDRRNVDIARQFGISKTQVGWIKNGKSWGHLNGHNDVR